VTDAPELVHLIPAGEIEARDGRKFVLADPAGVLARSMQAGGVDLPIDYEHQNDDAARRMSGPVPAAGWITELLAKPDGIWCKVTWTEKARGHIAAREYRYLSPSMIIDSATKHIFRIKGAALVHTPALHLTALAREDDATTATEAALARIASALGLEKDADELAILSAITTRAPRLIRPRISPLRRCRSCCANATRRTPSCAIWKRRPRSIRP